MKYIASAVVLLGVLAGAAHADNAAAVHKRAPLPQGIVTVVEIPTVLVEANRWSAADETAYRKAQAKQPSFWGSLKLAFKTDRDGRYAMH
jgi:hypothetical protein